MFNVIKILSVASLLVTVSCSSVDSQAKANYNTGEVKDERLANICQPYINLIKKYAATGDTQARLDYYNVKHSKEYDMCIQDYPKLSLAIKEANQKIEQKNNQFTQNIKDKYK